MPHIFRFHNGRNNNIYDWTASDRITPTDLVEVRDRVKELSSAAGTSIPTPIARMYLFKTAFEIVAKQMGQGTLDKDSLYAGLVSETLDLLELLYKNGRDPKRFRYERWTFDNNDTSNSRFGDRLGHQLLSQAFQQAAAQDPFNNHLEITLIYYKENQKELLLGGTSPFTFLFTSPNFKRKMREWGIRPMNGMVSNDVLFDSQYLQLLERDKSFISYIGQLVNTPGIPGSFDAITNYVATIRNRYPAAFDAPVPGLRSIAYGDSVLTVAGIPIQQVSEADFQDSINTQSDFRIRLPEASRWKSPLKPLFLLSKMATEGQYTSATNAWSPDTDFTAAEYPGTTVSEVMERELPGLPGMTYPFFSSFDFFENTLVKLPGYQLNPERYLTLCDDQDFLIPLKPLFLQVFPIQEIRQYVEIEANEQHLKVTINVPVFGPRGNRTIPCSKTYTTENTVVYEGIIGIYPFTRAKDLSLQFTNQYTVAAFEKTNADLISDGLKFLREDGTEIPAPALPRSTYADINTRSTYYQLSHSFDQIQLSFRKNNLRMSGVVIPLFIPVANGEAEYIYAIDFGTSNTHVAYGRVVDQRVQAALPFTISEKQMQMYMLNRPKREAVNDSESYLDYERSTGVKIDRAWQVTLREFIPFQIGDQRSASVRFPFRTATSESQNFIASPGNKRLFVDANIGFNIDRDLLADNVRYKTDLKWLLQNGINDPHHLNRVSLFARELFLMIRTKVLLEDDAGDLSRLRIILSFPISMGDRLKSKLTELFENQKNEIFSHFAHPFAPPVTESIAPYYELKAQNINIQNDNFCNIDVGGGTTDIILTKTATGNPRELQCFCSSFRFAGRQLWSSGANEYQQDENGFVDFYKHFLQKVDPDSFRSLKKALNGKTLKTEDVVGLLFSQPDYKFKEIFSEYSPFRVVLLIHYAAILYYITRLAEWKQIDLPRTVSFSGKGSEYINLIFSDRNDDDLRGFTQHLLQLFSGRTTHLNFAIAKSKEPKVITAKGALYYAVENIGETVENEWGNGENIPAAGSKRLLKNNVVYKGFRTLELENQTMTYADLLRDDRLYRDIMDNQVQFFSLLFDTPELAAIINRKLEITNFSSYKHFFIPEEGDIYQTGLLRDSYKATIAQLNPEDHIDDSPFFFSLNYALVRLSKAIAQTALNSTK